MTKSGDVSAEATPSRKTLPFRRWTHGVALAVMAGCAAPPPAPTLDAVAEGYVRAALQLAQHDPTLVEGWRGEPAWKPGPRVPVAEVARTVAELRIALDRVDPATGRHRYLAAQLGGLRFAARRLLGEVTSLDEQARDEFGIEFDQLDPAQMTAIRASIERVLPGPGAAADRFARLKTRTRVPDDRRAAVMEAALAACRRATAAAVPLPTSERVTVEVTAGLWWDGYARYAGGGQTRIEISGDGPLDVARALRLACHEGYPGHHVQYVLLDQVGWPELGLLPGFGPHLLFAEGAAEAAADLAMSSDERARIYREQLLPAAGLPVVDADALARVDELVTGLHPVVTEVARVYADGSLPRDRAVARLRDEALILNADATIDLIERKRARALVYVEGRRAVYARLRARSLEELHHLFTRAIALQ